MRIEGTHHDDTLTGTSGNDVFDLAKGGDDRASGLGGTDTFLMGAELTAADRLDGGDGNDRVNLDGDYSAGLVLGARTFSSIASIQFSAGHSYRLITNDANVAAGDMLNVNGAALGAGDTLIFNGSHESDGRFVITGGAGNDRLLGGAGADRFRLWLSGGGDDTVKAGAGNDLIHLGHALTAADTIAGGAGSDTVFLTGDYSGLTFASSTIHSVEVLNLGPGHDYNLQLADGNVHARHTLEIDASRLGINDHAIVEGSALTRGALHFIAGAGQNVFDGGAGNDIYDFTLGQYDAGNGGGGDDTYNFGANFGLFSYPNGGGGTNTVNLEGNYPSIDLFGGGNITNIQNINFNGAHSYTGITISGDIAGGAALTLDASASSLFQADLSAATSSAYHVSGGAGDDTVTFGGNFAVADTFDGGAGNDTLNLDGDYGVFSNSDITLGATTITNIDTIVLGTAHDYYITLNDGNVAAGDTMTIDASALASSDVINIDGAAETDGHFHFISGISDFTFTGGGLVDTFTLTGGTDGLATGNGGADIFTFGSSYSPGSFTVDGGTGSDVLNFNGDYSSLDLSDSNFTSVETVNFEGGHSYTGVTVNGNLAGAALTLDASASSFFEVDLSAATSATNHVIGGAGNDILTGSAGTDILEGGAGDNTFDGGAGADHIISGDGADTYVLNTGDSIGAAPDIISGFDFGAATMSCDMAITLFAGDASRSSTETTLDADIAAVTTAFNIGTGAYFTFTEDNAASADFGHYFLVIDQNGQAGYQAGHDTVIDITGHTGNPASLQFVTH